MFARFGSEAGGGVGELAPGCCMAVAGCGMGELAPGCSMVVAGTPGLQVTHEVAVALLSHGRGPRAGLQAGSGAVAWL